MTKQLFKAPLIQNGEMNAAYIEIPFDVEKEYGAKRAKVKAILNGVEYRGSVVRMETTCHILGVPKVIRDKMGATYGDVIEVEMEKDEEERVIVIPDDLKKQLSEKGLVAFQSLSFSQQKKHVLAVESAKREATRANRIAAIVAGMDNK